MEKEKELRMRIGRVVPMGSCLAASVLTATMTGVGCYEQVIGNTGGAVDVEGISSTCNGPAKKPVLTRRTRLHVPENTNALAAAEAYEAAGRDDDAALMRQLAGQPQSVWLVGGTPDEISDRVRGVMADARAKRQVPVLVVYNVPGRDCSQYSAGGATTEEEYQQWIDAVARAIGRNKAVVIVEPDGIALLSSEPWCGEGGGGFTGEAEDYARVEERFREIRYAVDRLERQPNVATYIDAGHSAWHPLNDYDAYYGVPNLQFGVVSRLMLAGIGRAEGFALNTSNTRADDELLAYGVRVSKCLRLLRKDPGYELPEIYSPEAVYDDEGRFAHPCPSDDVLDAMPIRPRDIKKMTHFVLDSSRNGQGPWLLGEPDTTNDDASAFESMYGYETTDPETWCNAPGRGIGRRPTTRTDHPLLDAYLWVKVPGESDGQCRRNLTAPDPAWPDSYDVAWEQVDPAAGQWFEEQILELTSLAVPPLLP
jgi:endoglucanase